MGLFNDLTNIYHLSYACCARTSRIIDGTGACPVAPEDGTGVKFSSSETMCFLLFHRDRRTVQRISLGRFTQFNPRGLFNRGSKNKNETRNIHPVPLFIFTVSQLWREKGLDKDHFLCEISRNLIKEQLD